MIPGNPNISSSVKVYSSIAAITAHIGLINQLCPHRYPLITHGWREAIMVKCLAHLFHKCHGRDTDIPTVSDHAYTFQELEVR